MLNVANSGKVRRLRLLASDMLSREEFRAIAACLAASIVGFAVSWIGTEPAHITGMHWDTGAWLSQISTGSVNWRRSGIVWNSHAVLLHLYIAAAAMSRLVGGNAFDGFRSLQAISVGGGSALFCLAALRLARSSLVALLLAICFASAWGIVTLMFAMVDNLLYLPPILGVVWICVERLGRWRDRDSIAAGLIVGIASLISVQCVIYLALPILAATVLGGPRTLIVKLRQTAVVGGAFIAIYVCWGLILAATTDSPTGRIFATLFSRPAASFLPSDAHSLRSMFDFKEIVHHLGMGVVQEIVTVGDATSLYDRIPHIGLWVFLVEVVACGTALFLYYRRRIDGRLVFVSSILLLMTLETSLYHDLLSDKYKRYDFLPVWVFLMIASLVGIVRARRHIAIPSVALGAILLIGIQTKLAIARNREWHTLLPTFGNGLNDYCGRDNLSWMGYFEKLRLQHPQACRFVFAVDEFKSIRWNHEITAALVTQLPHYAMVGAPTDVENWKFRPPLISVGETELQPCDWISPEARVHLSHRQ